MYELEAPDHLPNSLLCPINEKNPKGSVLGFCVVSPRVTPSQLFASLTAGRGTSIMGSPVVRNVDGY